jgi:hypothetical protein
VGGRFTASHSPSDIGPPRTPRLQERPSTPPSALCYGLLARFFFFHFFNQAVCRGVQAFQAWRAMSLALLLLCCFSFFSDFACTSRPPRSSSPAPSSFSVASARQASGGGVTAASLLFNQVLPPQPNALSFSWSRQAQQQARLHHRPGSFLQMEGITSKNPDRAFFFALLFVLHRQRASASPPPSHSATSESGSASSTLAERRRLTSGSRASAAGQPRRPPVHRGPRHRGWMRIFDRRGGQGTKEEGPFQNICVMHGFCSYAHWLRFPKFVSIRSRPCFYPFLPVRVSPTDIPLPSQTSFPSW